MIRKQFSVGARRLSYWDNEKDGAALICLHGHFGCAAMFAFLDDVSPGRMLALDQRGHGNSDRFGSYKTSDYTDDLRRLVEHEAIVRPAILGHSLGGVNAYHYASQYQDVRALVIEDIGTEVDCSNEFIKKLPVSFSSLREMEIQFQKYGLAFDPYFLESARYDGTRWRFQFDYDDMVESQRQMNGNHANSWTGLTCPILLLHGTNSWACATRNIVEMAEGRPHVTLKLYEGCGHTLHDEQRDRFTQDVLEFLKKHSGSPDHSAAGFNRMHSAHR